MWSKGRMAPSGSRPRSPCTGSTTEPRARSPPNPASGLHHFTLYRGGVPTADGCPGPGTFLASVSRGTRSFVDPGLASDTNAYFYSVRAANALGVEDPGG